MIYMRGNCLDYDYWVDLGNKGWFYEEIFFYFKKFEDNQVYNNEYYGVGGEWMIDIYCYQYFLFKVLLSVIKQVGYFLNFDFNGEV